MFPSCHLLKHELPNLAIKKQFLIALLQNVLHWVSSDATALFFFIQYYLKTFLHCSITKVKIYIWIWCYYTLALEIDTRIQNYLANWECFADSTYFCFLSSNIPHRARDGTVLAFIFSKEWVTWLQKVTGVWLGGGH